MAHYKTMSGYNCRNKCAYRLTVIDEMLIKMWQIWHPQNGCSRSNQIQIYWTTKG